MTVCCEGTGIITWEDDGKRYWSPCACDLGEALGAEITKGEAQIRGGQLHKWSDIKRERTDRDRQRYS